MRKAGLEEAQAGIKIGGRNINNLKLFAWSGQSTGVSALASSLPKKSQGWSPSEWTGWISLQSKGLLRVFSNITVQLNVCPYGSAGKESAWYVGDLGSIPGLGRSSEEGNGYPLQYSSLGNSMDCIVHGVAKSRTLLRDFHTNICPTNGWYLSFPHWLSIV